MTNTNINSVGARLVGVDDPTRDDHAATKGYVDAHGGGAVSVTDGTHTVTGTTELDFTSGATVTDAGGGVAQVAVAGGGSLPTGWTQDASNPATVNTNGGFQRFGSDGGFVVPNAGFIISDSNVGFAVNGDLAMGNQAITGLPAPTTDTEPATKHFVDRRSLADGESVQYIAVEDTDAVISISDSAGILSIRGTNADGIPTFYLDTVGNLQIADGSGGLVGVFVPQSVPEIPATPSAQDVTDALVALGLATQAS